MSSLLMNLAARCSPRNVAAASRSAARTTRARDVRSLSFLAFSPRGVAGTSASSVTSARQLRTSRPSFAPQQRFMYMEAEKISPVPQETTYGGGVEDSAQAATEPTEGKPVAPQELDFFEALVAGIPFNMMQSDFQAYLEDAGVKPTSIVLPMRPSTSNRIGQNKGRAYVAFDTEEDLNKLLALHGATLSDRPVTVRRLAVSFAKATTVVVRTTRGITEEVLMEVMERELGTVPQYMNMTENVERNTCYVWVALESHEQAIQAIALDGANIMGRWLDVGISPGVVKEEQRREDLNEIPLFQPFEVYPAEGKVIVVRGIPFDLHERELLAFFEQYGVPKEAILQLRMPKHDSRGRNTGLAYINSTDRDTDLILNLHGSYIHDRWIDISLWRDRGADGTPDATGLETTRLTTPAGLRQKYPELPCLEISNISFDKSQEELMAFLEENGVPRTAISEIVMPKYRQTANNIGFAWVVMNDEAATNRMMELTGSTFHERWLTIGEADYPPPHA